MPEQPRPDDELPEDTVDPDLDGDDTIALNVTIDDLPLMRREHSAIHRVLWERLRGEVSLQAWSGLISAHDDLCDAVNARDEDE